MWFAGPRDTSLLTHGEKGGHHILPAGPRRAERLPVIKAAPARQRVRTSMVGCYQLTKPCAPGTAREGTKR